MADQWACRRIVAMAWRFWSFTTRVVMACERMAEEVAQCHLFRRQTRVRPLFASWREGALQAKVDYFQACGRAGRGGRVGDDGRQGRCTSHAHSSTGDGNDRSTATIVAWPHSILLGSRSSAGSRSRAGRSTPTPTTLASQRPSLRAATVRWREHVSVLLRARRVVARWKGELLLLGMQRW